MNLWEIGKISVIVASLSTLSMAIFCYLHDSDAFVKANRTIHNEMWYYRFCANSNEQSSNGDYDKIRAENWTLLAVVRHPIDRFVSGYVDKCIKLVLFYKMLEFRVLKNEIIRSLKPKNMSLRAKIGTEKSCFSSCLCIRQLISESCNYTA